MESWREVWRKGFMPVLSTKGLEALKAGLESDDKRITQGQTTVPVPMACTQDWPVEAACPVAYCGWIGEGLTTVGDAEEFFARAVYEADQQLGEVAGFRHFMNWVDDSPREVVIREVLGEVTTELERRSQVTVPTLHDYEINALKVDKEHGNPVA